MTISFYIQLLNHCNKPNKGLASTLATHLGPCNKT